MSSKINTETPSPAEVAARSARIAPLVPILQAKIKAVAIKIGRSQDADDAFQCIFEQFLMSGDVEQSDAAIISYYCQMAKWQMQNERRSEGKFISTNVYTAGEMEGEGSSYEFDLPDNRNPDKILSCKSNADRLNSIVATLTAVDQRNLSALASADSASEAAETLGIDKSLITRTLNRLKAAWAASEAAAEVEYE